MSYYANAVVRRMYMPEPSLDEPEPVWDGRCPICGCRLNIFDPAPLCGVCARDDEEEKWQ